MLSPIFLRIGLALLLSAPVVLAQAVPTTSALRLEPGQAPTIDGVLDEEIWQRAVSLGSLTQVTPNEGAAPSQKTEVLLAFDERQIYIGIRCFDNQVDKLRATQRRRDANLDPDDSIELLFDPFLDRRNAFWFQIGPGGARGDALIVKNGRSFNKRWNTIWEGRSTVTDDGWFAELAIPFASLNFEATQSDWGFNFRRFIKRHGEEARWASPQRKVRFFSVADAGILTGMRDLHQGLGLDVTPFMVGDWIGQADDAGDDLNLEAGFDVFWQPTPATKVALSYNTDFAQAEVDQTKVNLTRFGLSFPEKRGFFLEDSGNFFFPNPNGVNAFFSRRIGLVSGNVVPLLGALKYTGQSESGSFGILNASTDSTTLDPSGTPLSLDAQNLFVARYSHNISDEIDAGILITRGDPSGADQDATTVGLDWTWRTSKFRGNDNLQVTAALLGASNDPTGQQEGLPTAFSVGVKAPNDETRWEARTSYVAPDFNPALGFVTRSGYRRYDAEYGWEPRFNETPWLRKMEFSLHPTLITDTAGHFDSLRVQSDLMGMHFESGDRLSVQAIGNFERLDDGFDVLDGMPVIPGRYDNGRAGIELRASDRREVSGKLSFWDGGFWDGTQRNYEGKLVWRPNALLSLESSLTRQELELSSGAFDVHIGRVRTDLAFTPDLSCSFDVQWDNVSETVGMNSRLWWIAGPGREMFFVVNQGWDRENSGYDPTGTGVVLKLAYTFRF